MTGTGTFPAVVKLGILIASARSNRVGTHVASWVTEHVDPSFDIDLIDLGAVALPNFDEEFSPKQGEPYAHAHTLAWSERVSGLDAIVVVTPEYNGSIPGALKTAVDYLHREWAELPVAVVSYGWREGAGAILEAERLLRFVGADVLGSVGLQFQADLGLEGALSVRPEKVEELEALLARVRESVLVTAQTA